MAISSKAVKLFMPWAGKKLLINSRFSAVRVQTINQVKSFYNQASSSLQSYNKLAKAPLQKISHFAPERRDSVLIKTFCLVPYTFGFTSFFYYLHKWNEQGTLKNMTTVWPQFVEDRIQSTYAYFSASIVISTVSIYYISQTTKLLNHMIRSPYLTFGATFAALIGSGMLVIFMPYSNGINGKHLAWILHNCTVGIAVVYLCSLGPHSISAAMYIAGAMVGFSIFGAWAPNEDRLSHMRDYAFAFGIANVLLSTIATKTFLFPSTTILGSGLFDITNYGLLAIICTYFLNGTKRVVNRAKMYDNLYGPYDPINESISIYIDSLKHMFKMLCDS